MAGLIIQLDRPVLTYDFTYTMPGPASSIALFSRKAIAFDSVHAAPGIARRLAKVIHAANNPPARPGQK